MEKSENIMGTKKVMPLLISMSVPPMISMLIQALYNIVDSMYVARVSEDALTAVSIAFPLQNLIIAVSCGFGIGLNACVARALGAKDEKEVTSAATHGFPAMGVQGAAIATVASQIFAAALSMVFFLKKCTSVRICLKGFRIKKSMLCKLYAVGIPSAIMMSLPSVLVAALNSVLAAFQATAIAVFGLYIKIQTFVYMPANGVIQGMRPIMSYNYGAGNKKRMKETLIASLEAAGVIMAIGTVLFMAFPQSIMKLFDANKEMLSIGVPMLRMIAAGFLVSTVGCVLSGAFEALGMGVQSLIVSLLRQLLIIIPLSMVLSRIWGIYGVWITFPIAELAAAVTGCILYRNFLQKNK